MSPPTSDTEDAFTSVTHKKPARAPRNRKGKQNKPRVRTLEERVASRRVGLVDSGYLRECRELLRTALSSGGAPAPVCVVCLGLGSVTDSTKSQDQFVLLQELLEELGTSVLDKTTIYDPVNTPEDVEYFTNAGLEPLLQEHDLLVDRTTLLYMPHCPRPLFDDLLRLNWSESKLGRLLILGNRLDMYSDSTYSGSSSSSRSPFVSKAAPVFDITPLPSTKDHFEAFNDLALQWVPRARIAEQDEEFWRFNVREGRESVEGESLDVMGPTGSELEEADPAREVSVAQQLVEGLEGLSVK